MNFSFHSFQVQIFQIALNNYEFIYKNRFFNN
jgi:hypothetical protein